MKSQVIAIFEAALANPAYLNPAFNLDTGKLEDPDDYHEHGNNWFCVITESELDKAGLNGTNIGTECFDRIKQSIKPCSFLKTYLIDKGPITDRDDYDSPKYKTAAHAHWRELIEKIKAEK